MSWLSEIELNKSTFFPLSGQMFCQKRLPESCGCARVRDDLLPRCPRVVRRRRRLIRRGRLRLNVSVSPAAEKPAVQIGCSGWGGLTVDRANVLSKTFAVMLWLCKGAGRSVARGSEGGPKTVRRRGHLICRGRLRLNAFRISCGRKSGRSDRVGGREGV